MSPRFFACLSAALGWAACVTASVAADFRWYVIALAAFNAAYWVIAATVDLVRPVRS